MTNKNSRKRRGSLQTDTLKTAIVLGGVMATLIGSEMLATPTAPPVETVLASPAPQTVVIPQEDGSFTLELAPIPDLVIPEPVARSQSSR